MQKAKSQSKIQNLRKKYPRFVYEDFSYKVIGNNFEVAFDFKIEPTIKFRPKIIIEDIDRKRLAGIGDRMLNNLIFHLGLIEIPSYWKATCSPEIEIKAGYLDKKQINWWKKLFIDGMGQFYYENKIDWREPDFLKIISAGKRTGKIYQKKLKNRYLVPLAGGRDSIVTLEGLKKLKREISLFTVNPIEKIQKTVKVSGVKKQIIVRRIIDKKLLKLNKKGHLNGHTPFTSLLSFMSVLCAVIFDYKNIAFSNEKSANEGNVKYLGKVINHQWAKSSEFEKRFSAYAKKYLARDLNYFSFTRKYGELEISKIITKYPQYFPVFSSCNAGMRINFKESPARHASQLTGIAGRWCCNCPKCLFVYATLYPFLEKKDLLKIFGKDIFENRGLLPIMNGLLGKTKNKPFECVGTFKESQTAFNLCLKKAWQSDNIPYLLKKYNNEIS